MSARVPGRWDVLAALVVCATLGGSFNVPAEGPAERPADGWVVVVTAASALAVLVARRWPYAAVPLLVLALGGYGVGGYTGGPVYLAAPLGLFLIGLARGWRWTSMAGVILGSAIVVGRAMGPGGVLLALTALAVGWVVAPVLAAELLRTRIERVAERRRRQDRRQQEEVMAERLRIAQDLHDGVAHALSLITIQARVASRAVAAGPAADALSVITTTSSAAMADLTAMVKGLRDATPAPRHPVGSMDQVGDLVAQARATGQQVELTGDLAGAPSGDSAGAPSGELPGSVGGAAYRVVQEGLTNARRHAPGAVVQVQLGHVGEEFVVRVRNGGHTAGRTGPGARHAEQSAGSGLGLVGMRERVHATGGTVRAVPLSDGGWEVLARWPSHSGS